MVKCLTLQHVKLLPARAGDRTAVLARRDGDLDWVQVESISGYEDALAYALELENNATDRVEQIRQLQSEHWGDDAPEIATA